MRTRRRWAPLYLAPVFAMGLFPLWASMRSVHPDREMQIVGRLSWIIAYWSLAAICNYRFATVRPSGVSVRILPLPVGSGHSIPLQKIARVYVRRIIETTDSDLVCRDDFEIGIETTRGHQLDLGERYATEADAIGPARQIASILGWPAPVEVVEAQHTDSTWKRQLLFWTLLVLALTLNRYLAPI